MTKMNFEETQPFPAAFRLADHTTHDEGAARSFLREIIVTSLEEAMKDLIFGGQEHSEAGPEDRTAELSIELS